MIDLTCDRVSKRYRIPRPNAAAGGTAHLWDRLRTPMAEFWALRDVSFDVARGEALGIIGHNGAGKSTILKLLSKITRPSSGQIRYYGRLAALIELGSGFHPDLTGRENVMLSGAILGMKPREVRAKLPAIVDFAGVGDFIDTPVKWYSSGMYVRLGFAIAAHLDPDVLLVDEVLAVGDAAFQSKCLQRIAALKQRGTTILFVSHDLAAVQQLCNRVLLLEKGRVLTCGDPVSTVREYLRTVAERHTTLPADVEAVARGVVSIRGLTVHDGRGAKAVEISTGDPFRVRVEYSAARSTGDVAFEVFFYTQDGSVLVCQATTEAGGRRLDLAHGSGVVELTSPHLPLQPGTYALGALVRKRGSAAALDWVYDPIMLRAVPGVMVRGQFYLATDWTVSREGRVPADETAAGEPVLGHQENWR
jgi:homopolymeric O-antigen transport system ATP-binding protein